MRIYATRFIILSLYAYNKYFHKSSVLYGTSCRRLCAILVTKSNKMCKMKIENLENSSR
jgi:hypothetical protein